MKNLSRQVIEPKILELLKKLRKGELETQYFDLSDEEKLMVSKSISTKSLDETAKLFSNTEYYKDPKFIYTLSIENLSTLIEIFEREEMYNLCGMLYDAVKLLNDELQTLVDKQL